MTDLKTLIDPQAWLDQDVVERPGTPEFEARFGADLAAQRGALREALDRRRNRLLQLLNSINDLPLDAATSALVDETFKNLVDVIDNIENNNLKSASREVVAPHKPIAEMTTEEMLAFTDSQPQDFSNKAEWDGDEMKLGPMYFYCVEHPDQMVTAAFRKLSALGRWSK